MKTRNKVALILIAGCLTILASCGHNYYSGTKKGSNCGCPSHKGMTGY